MAGGSGGKLRAADGKGGCCGHVLTTENAVVVGNDGGSVTGIDGLVGTGTGPSEFTSGLDAGGSGAAVAGGEGSIVAIGACGG